jgi:ABC-type dipeptide/oligopeptide/nickel transport system permease subunit
MESLPSRPLLTALVVAVTVAYSLGAATTTPFSVAADVVTAIPIVLLAVAVVVCWPLHPHASAHPSPPTATGPGAPDGRGHPFLPWVAITAVLVAWELLEYLAPGSRGAHPTLSSMADAVDRIFAFKALVFFGWIWLCVAIVRSGAAGPGAEPRT